MKTKCPLFKKPCLETGCEWFFNIRGTDKNTGNEIDQSGCAVTFLPMLLIENTAAQHQMGAAVEDTRNIFADALNNPRGLENE